MGLRSPQELEQVRHNSQPAPLVDAAKVDTLDLATPVGNFLEQKNMGDQIKSLQERAISKKNAAKRIAAKYAVDSATEEYKLRIASLKGDNALRDGGKIYNEALAELDKLESDVPSDMSEAYTEAKNQRHKDLYSLTLSTLLKESTEASIKKGEIQSKALTNDASSKFMDVGEFLVAYDALLNNALDTEEQKGNGRGKGEAGFINATFIASNSVVEGVEFTLSQAATPDMVDNIEKHYREKILNSGVVVIEEDKRKIENAFSSAKAKVKDDLAYVLASEARKMEPTQAENYIFTGAKGSAEVVTKANTITRLQWSADKAQRERKDMLVSTQIIAALDASNPDFGKAMASLGQLSDAARPGMEAYLRSRATPGARPFSDPNFMVGFSNLLRDNPQEAAKVNLRAAPVAKDDLSFMMRAQEGIGKMNERREHSLASGSGEQNAITTAINMASARLGRRYGKPNTPENTSVRETARVLYYAAYNDLVDSGIKNPKESEVHGRYVEYLKDQLFKVKQEDTFLGKMGNALKGIGVDNSLAGRQEDVYELRPASEVKRNRFTGNLTGDYIPEPTKEQLDQVRKELNQPNYTDKQATDAYMLYKRKERARSKSN